MKFLVDYLINNLKLCMVSMAGALLYHHGVIAHVTIVNAVNLLIISHVVALIIQGNYLVQESLQTLLVCWFFVYSLNYFIYFFTITS